MPLRSSPIFTVVVPFEEGKVTVGEQLLLIKPHAQTQSGCSVQIKVTVIGFRVLATSTRMTGSVTPGHSAIRPSVRHEKPGKESKPSSV